MRTPADVGENFGLVVFSKRPLERVASGATSKELIHEEFDDEIMSAIDFRMDAAREADPTGDRVKITMSGKFLAYKTILSEYAPFSGRPADSAFMAQMSCVSDSTPLQLLRSRRRVAEAQH